MTQVMISGLLYPTVLQECAEHPRDAIWTHHSPIRPCHHLIDWMSALDLFSSQLLEVRDGLVYQGERPVAPVGLGVVVVQQDCAVLCNRVLDVHGVLREVNVRPPQPTHLRPSQTVKQCQGNCHPYGLTCLLCRLQQPCYFSPAERSRLLLRLSFRPLNQGFWIGLYRLVSHSIVQCPSDDDEILLDRLLGMVCQHSVAELLEHPPSDVSYRIASKRRKDMHPGIVLVRLRCVCPYRDILVIEPSIHIL